MKANSRQPLSRRIGLILAGGEARRFGGGKCQALLEGRPLLEWVYRALTPLVEGIWLSVREVPLFYPEGLEFSKIIPDEIPGAGPVKALSSILSRYPEYIFLVVPCDQPLLQVSLLEFLLQQVPPFRIALCYDEERLLPFPGVFAGGTLLKGTSFKEALSRTSALKKIGPGEWRKFDPRGLSFFNVNHREDLEIACRLINLQDFPVDPQAKIWSRKKLPK